MSNVRIKSQFEIEMLFASGFVSMRNHQGALE